MEMENNMCDHIWVYRNLNPTLNGTNPHMAWICYKCGILKDSVSSKKYWW